MSTLGNRVEFGGRSRIALAMSSLWTIARLSAKHPATSRHSLKSMMQQLEDMEFYNNSPIECLSDEALKKIYRWDISVPPLVNFKSGNQSVSGLMFLCSLGHFVSARTIFEIGTYTGLTARCLAENLQSAVVHTLELPLTEKPSLEITQGDRTHRTTSTHQGEMVEGLSGRVVQHWGDSATFDFAQWNHQCDLVYIDGAHSHEYVVADTLTALNIIAPGGAIVWDDYWPRAGDVAQVLDKWSDLQLFRVPGTRLVVHFSEPSQLLSS